MNASYQRITVTRTQFESIGCLKIEGLVDHRQPDRTDRILPANQVPRRAKSRKRSRLTWVSAARFCRFASKNWRGLMLSAADLGDVSTAGK